MRANVRGKGLKGAVGTSASYTQLLEGSALTAPRQLEAQVMASLGLEAFPVATQTYPRKQDWLVLNALAGLCATLHKFAFDLRILQSPPWRMERTFWRRTGVKAPCPSSANPITAENIDSLARLVAALPRVAWDNAAFSLLERTLDDSANRRLLLPEAFLLTDEILRRAQGLVEGMHFWTAPSSATSTTAASLPPPNAC